MDSGRGGSPAWFQIDNFTDRQRGIPPVDIRCGRGRTGELGSYLRERGLRRALIVTGRHVGANPTVMGALREALGTRLAGEFTGATPEKTITSIYAGIDRLRACAADVVVGVGGGASLVIARQISALAADGRPLHEVRREVRDTGRLRLRPDPAATPVIVIPTTLAGGDLSTGGTFRVLEREDSPSGRPVNVNPPGVGPVAAFYDPQLVESTPADLLAGSAINGLNKGVESVYAPAATHYSDALAGQGVTLMSKGLLRLASDRPGGLDLAVPGIILAQLKRDISVLHAFGQVVSRRFGVQQGIAHAVITPPALATLLAVADLRRHRLAEALRAAGATTAADDAEAVVGGLTAVRDALRLPSRLRDIGDVEAVDLRRCAEEVCAEPLVARAPLDPPLTVDQALTILRAAA